jgi:sialidase-1
MKRQSKWTKNLPGRLIMKLMIVFIVTLISISFVYADDSLIAYLPFDDGSGDDVTGNGNNGEYIGDVKEGEGKFGTGVELDGKSYVDIPWSESIDVADGDFSIEIWFRYEQASANGVLVWCFDVESGPHAQAWFRTEPGSNRIRGLINDGTGTPSVIVVTAEPFNDGAWHHMAAIRSGNSLKMYIDGELKDSQSGDVGSITSTQTFGIQLGRKMGDRDMLTGNLDEFRLWKKALADAEIKSNMGKAKDNFLAVKPEYSLTNTWGSIKN